MDGANRSVTRGCAAKDLARRALMHCGRYLAHGRATNKKQPHLRGGCCISQALLDVAIATMWSVRPNHFLTKCDTPFQSAGGGFVRISEIRSTYKAAVAARNLEVE
jgi:hypothetical protein